MLERHAILPSMKVEAGSTQNLGAAHTVAFVKANIAPAASVLDAGSGNGALAKLLIDEGFSVTAIDSHEDAVAEAAANGIKVEHIGIREFEREAAFDAILFSRSFHHMQPLDKTAEQARKLLKPDGLLLMEEFAAELVDAPTATWFYGLKTLFKATHGHLHGRGPKVEDGKIPADPAEDWRKHHFGKHGVAESSEMLEALNSAGFELLEQTRLPFLYRYFLDDATTAQCQALFEWESRLCATKSIQTIGLRLIARKK